MKNEIISRKDFNNLINKPNDTFSGLVCRVALYNMPDSILDFYERYQYLIEADVVIVRSKNDEANAAHIRNSSEKAFFVFSDKYWVTSYFKGVCATMSLPAALINRI